MSYILDALRKSDQQRQRGAAPTLLTAQATVPPTHQPGFSLNGWVVTALVGAGILIGWLRPWQMEPAAPMPEPLATQPLAARPAASTPASPALGPDLSNAAGEPASVQAPVQSSITATKPAPTPASTVKAEMPAPATSHEARVAAREETSLPESPVATEPAEAERGKDVMPFSDLPPSIRQEIPDIAISFHVYANKPADRRIMINNELLRQGDSLPPGLVVERITPDGVVIGYKGYRFQRGVR